MSQVSVIGLFLIAVLWAAYVAQPVVVPVVLAWTIATIVLPVVTWMQGYRIPRGVGGAAGNGSAGRHHRRASAAAVDADHLLARPGLPSSARLMREKFQMMSQPLAMLDEVRKALNAITVGGEGGIKVETQSGTLVTSIIGVLTPAVSQFILFIGALIFYLVYQKRIRTTAVFFVRDRDARLTTLRTLSDIDSNMTIYFGTFTVVNVCLGVVTVLLTWAVGLPNPLLWGVLAAVLNYVPYIGPAIVTGTLAVVGLLTFPTLDRGGRRPARLHRNCHRGGPLPDADGHRPPADAQSVRRISGHRLLHVAVGADRRLPGGAAADGLDRGAGQRLRGGKALPARVNQSRIVGRVVSWKQLCLHNLPSRGVDHGTDPAQRPHRLADADIKDKATDQFERMADKATDQFNRFADQAEGVASRVAEQGREAGEKVQEVAGNLKGAVDKSVKDQPMATLAMAAAVGFVLGALWKS